MYLGTDHHTHDTLSLLSGIHALSFMVTSHTPPSHPFSLCTRISSGRYSTCVVFWMPFRQARLIASSTIGRITTGRAIKLRVEIEADGHHEVREFLALPDVGSGHWAPSDETDVPGVEDD